MIANEAEYSGGRGTRTAALLRGCCRRVIGERRGTGLFIAPDILVTCAHVVGARPTGTEVDIRTRDDVRSRATVLALDPNVDVAILRLLDSESALHAPLNSDILDEDKVVGMGFAAPSDGRVEFKQYLAEFESQNEVRENDRTTIEWQLKGGQVEPGFSGGPVLNKRTLAVAGIMKATRNRYNTLGGLFIPAHDVLDVIRGLGLVLPQPPADWREANAADLRRVSSRTRGGPGWFDNKHEYAFASLNHELERLFAEGEVVESFDATRRIVQLAMNDMREHGSSDYSRMGLGNMLVNGIRSSSYLRDNGIALIDFLSTEVRSAAEWKLLVQPDATAVQLELLAVNQGYRNYGLVNQLIDELETSPYLDGIMRLKLNSRRVLAAFTGGDGLEDAAVLALASSNEGDSKHAIRSPLVRSWGAIARGDIDLAEMLVSRALQELDSRKSMLSSGSYDAILELELRLTFKSMRKEIDLGLHRRNDNAISKLYGKFRSRPIALRPLVFDLIGGRERGGPPSPALVSYDKYQGIVAVPDSTRHMLARLTTTLFQSLR